MPLKTSDSFMSLFFCFYVLVNGYSTLAIVIIIIKLQLVFIEDLLPVWPWAKILIPQPLLCF